MKDVASKLDHNAAALKRWRSRLKRAISAIEKLERQRKRLETAATYQRNLQADLNRAPIERKPVPIESVVTPIPAERGEPDHLDIPGFLRRQAEPDPGTEKLKQEIEEKKRRKTKGRIETMKAKARGDLKKMPLTGRAALEAIRNA